MPEELFDLDGPGHYFRRIKTVAVSIPCVTGPYSSVNCTLTLLKSSIRKSPALRDGTYGRDDADDDRFDDYFGSLQSIVTSTAQNDSGLFETNLRDERYLPFEGSGVISEWQIELPANPSKGDPCAFDYDTISDVILHLRYTARDGGALLRNRALDDVTARIGDAEAAGSVRLFSIRHDFPGAWAKLKAPTEALRRELALTLRDEHYPYWSRGRLNVVKRVDVIARSAATPIPATVDVFDKVDDQGGAANKDPLVKDAASNLLMGKLDKIAAPARPTGDVKLFFGDAAFDDLWLAITWGA